MAPQELVALNFQLSNEVKRLRSELVALRALRMHEDCLELARFKEAYDELEREVVELRKEKIQKENELVTEKAHSQAAPSHDASSASEVELVSVLRTQLSDQSRRFDELQAKYSELRKEYTASPAVSTCASSTAVDHISLVSTDTVVIGVCCEEMFKRPGVTRKTVAMSDTLLPRVTVLAPKQKPALSIERLAKKARFSLNR